MKAQKVTNIFKENPEVNINMKVGFNTPMYNTYALWLLVSLKNSPYGMSLFIGPKFEYTWKHKTTE